MTEFDVTFPTVTGNHYKTLNFSRRRVFITKKGQMYRLMVKMDVAKSGAVRMDKPLEVDMTIYPPDRRRRDIDNICKTLFDALTLAGLWADDKLIKRLNVNVEEPSKAARIRLRVAEL